MDIEENKTVKSYITSSLSALLGFWVVLEPFRCFFLFCFSVCFGFFFDFLPLTPQRKSEKSRNDYKTTPKPRRDDNEQVMHDLTVLFSSIFIFNL